jgi:broad specificity phosphatase PhoE
LSDLVRAVVGDGAVAPAGDGPVVVLVRHGRAASGWDGDLDPGLAPDGAAQADHFAGRLGALAPVDLVSSPLRRARETAAPLERAWSVTARVEPAIGEIVAPAGHAGLEARGAWLREAMAGTWSDLGDEHHQWRSALIEALRAVETDTILFSHFIAVNVAVGAATGDDRVVCFAPGYCSATVLQVTGTGLDLLHLGDTGRTTVR